MSFKNQTSMIKALIALERAFQSFEEGDIPEKQAVARVFEIMGIPVLGNLVEFLKNENPHVRSRAGESIAAILTERTFEKPSSPSEALAALYEEVTIEKALIEETNRLIQAMANGDPKVNKEMIILSIADKLKDANDLIRFTAVECLRRIGTIAEITDIEEVVSLFTEAMKNEKVKGIEEYMEKAVESLKKEIR